VTLPPPDLSVVIPLYDEAPNLPDLHAQLLAALTPLGRSFEIVFVNDGSHDDSERILDDLARKDERIVVVHFRRNFGQTAAMAAGFDHSRGKILIPMDGDLQNDPGDIPRLLAKLDEGFDAVSGWRRSRRDPLSKKIPSRVANAVISYVSGVSLHDYGCTLKAYRREMIEGVGLYGEMHRFIPIYAFYRGARVTEIEVTHHPRSRGKSHYGIERTIKVLLDLVVVKFFGSYVNKPIYLFGTVGCLSLLVAFLALAAAAIFKLMPVGTIWHDVNLHKDFVATPLPVLGSLFAVIGVFLILQGLMAEMVMRTYYESQGKRVYLVHQVRNFSPPSSGETRPRDGSSPVIGRDTPPPSLS
jgi:glycosyltransferase involved in cell wall biosynthesis